MFSVDISCISRTTIIWIPAAEYFIAQIVLFLFTHEDARFFWFNYIVQLYNAWI